MNGKRISGVLYVINETKRQTSENKNNFHGTSFDKNGMIPPIRSVSARFASKPTLL